MKGLALMDGPQTAFYILATADVHPFADILSREVLRTTILIEEIEEHISLACMWSSMAGIVRLALYLRLILLFFGH